MRNDNVKIIIKGRVQGVSYRFFALKQAKTFNIKGWVKNEDNGDVKAYAEGDREDLDEYIKYLERGPIFSRFDEVILNY